MPLNILKKVKSVSKDLFTAPDASVLVVDDVAMNLKVFCGLLKQTKIQIDTASSGDEAIFMAALQQQSAE